MIGANRGLEGLDGPDAGLLSNVVLVVDDDPVVGRAMKLLMTNAGLEPIVCGTGADALAQAAGRPSWGGAIVDIHLPDMNGLTLSQRLRERLGPATPIVILSGDNSIDTLRSLPKAGATYFFAKPVNGSRLIEQLKLWMGIGKQ